MSRDSRDYRDDTHNPHSFGSNEHNERQIEIDNKKAHEDAIQAAHQATMNNPNDSQPTSTGGGGGCFVYETPVLTAAGLKQIGTIKKGDLVCAIAPDGSTSLQPVLTAKAHAPEPIWQVKATDCEIDTTCAHSLQTENGWKRVDQLKAGDVLTRFDNGNIVTMTVESVVKTDRAEPVFNLIVGGDYTFVVGDGYVAHSFTNFRFLRVQFSELKAWVRNTVLRSKIALRPIITAA